MNSCVCTGETMCFKHYEELMPHERCTSTGCCMRTIAHTTKCINHLADKITTYHVDSIRVDTSRVRGPVDKIAYANLVASIREKGILAPLTVRVNRDGFVFLIDGLYRYNAAREIGMHVVPCKVLKKELKNESMCYILYCNGIRSPGSIYCATHCVPDHQYSYTYTSVPPMPDISAARWQVDPMMQTFTITGGYVGKSTERVKQIRASNIKCLEPGCKILISKKMKSVKPERHFCKEHKLKARTYDNFPLTDRDGDAIWVSKDYMIVKIKDMEDSHLTNTLVFLETNAKKRCELTGLPAKMWQSKASNRYDLLLEEAVSRDEALKCNCDDGIIQMSVIDPETAQSSVETSICGHCVRGEERRKSKQLAFYMAKDSDRNKKKMAIQAASLIAVALIAGGAYSGGMEFINLVISYVKGII